MHPFEGEERARGIAKTTLGVMHMRPDRAYQGLAKARQRLFEWVRPLSQEQYVQQFPIGLRTLRATLVEIARGEWIYSRRIRGDAPTPPSEWPITEEWLPTFADLEPVWAEQAKMTQALLASTVDWDHRIEYRIQQQGKTIHLSATKADVATQLLFHEVHHRAQAMAMLRTLGVEAQNLDYSAFMYQRREEPA